MISADERKKMLAVPGCSEQVVARLESIGIKHLAELRYKDPYELLEHVNARARYAMWRPPIAIMVLDNLIEAAQSEPRRDV